MMRNRLDIEKQLKQFPKQRMSETSKKRMLSRILNTDDRSSRRQSRSHKRLNHVAVWAASIAAVILFGLLGASFINDEETLINSSAEKHSDIGDSEKTVPDIARQEKDDTSDTTDDTTNDKTETDQVDETTESDQENNQMDAQSQNNEESHQADAQSEDQTNDADIIDKSGTIIKALANRDMNALAKKVHPDKGLLFSPYVYITENAVVVDKQDVPDLLQIDEQWTWGDYDGKGTPINQTPEQYFDEFIDMSPFVNEPDNILIDEQKKRGNTKNNIKDVFPDSKVVEYYDSGTEEYTGIDWSSVNLVYETDADGIWRLVAIVRDVWTI